MTILELITATVITVIITMILTVILTSGKILFWHHATNRVFDSLKLSALEIERKGKVLTRVNQAVIETAEQLQRSINLKSDEIDHTLKSFQLAVNGLPEEIKQSFKGYVDHVTFQLDGDTNIVYPNDAKYTTFRCTKVSGDLDYEEMRNLIITLLICVEMKGARPNDPSKAYDWAKQACLNTDLKQLVESLGETIAKVKFDIEVRMRQKDEKDESDKKDSLDKR